MLEFIECDGVAYWPDMPNKLVWDYSYTKEVNPEVAYLERRYIEVQLVVDNMKSPRFVGFIRETADNKWHLVVNWASGCTTTVDTLDEAKLNFKVVFAMEDLYGKYARMNEEVPF